ncbi:MAG: hypothetical protein RL274_1010 [Pseudomonadota bacterium]
MRRIIGAVIGLVLISASGSAAQDRWLGAFGHAPTAYNLSPPSTNLGPDGTVRTVTPGFAPLPPYRAETTVRDVIRLSASARSIRVRFSNELLDSALQIGEAHIALASENGEIIPGSDHVLTFAGQRSAVIPAGAPLLSDPHDWGAPAMTKLAITVYYPIETVPPAHTLYARNAWAAPGNQAGAQSLVGAVPARSGSHFSEIDIVSQTAKHTVVCLGDSITEGVGSTRGEFRGWPDRLAERLQASSFTRAWSVVNAGIGSNRLLHNTPSTSALSRFDRDVLVVPGVSKVIISLGINDIQYSRRNPVEAVSADDMIAAMGQLIARARARGVGVIGGTITPFEGSSSYSPDGEAMRSKVNEWIRSSGAFDGVIDFDRAIRDPLRPAQLLATADSGGRLHPNDAGYALMGDAIDLKLFVD